MKTENREQFETEPEVDESKREAAQKAREILGLKPEATLEDIKKVYRRLALWCHPDKRPPAERDSATQLFVKLGQLYKTLCTAEELERNADEDRYKDEAEDRDLEPLGDFFLDTLQIDVDPAMWSIINDYNGQYEKQEEVKGQEIDITEGGISKGDKDNQDKGGEVDIIEKGSRKGDEDKGGKLDIKA